MYEGIYLHVNTMVYIRGNILYIIYIYVYMPGGCLDYVLATIHGKI